MSDTQLSNEQKLEEIYLIIKAGERRRLQASLVRILKWVIIIGLIGFIATNPSIFIQKITQIIQPIVMDEVQSMMNSNKDALMQSVKDILPNQ